MKKKKGNMKSILIEEAGKFSTSDPDNEESEQEVEPPAKNAAPYFLLWVKSM